MMAHWHDFNPWAAEVIYLPDLDELSACINPLRPESLAIRVREQYGEKVDCYILLQPSGFHDCGIRYGKEGHEYLSPHIDRYIAELLISKYGPHRDLIVAALEMYEALLRRKAEGRS